MTSPANEAVVPFRQSAFRDLPDRPRREHVFEACAPLELAIDSREFGSMRVHVRRFGAGPPLLLVHGLMTSSYSWRYAFAALGERFTCYAPDLPGAGATECVLGPRFTPEVLARWLADVQRSLGIRGCPVVGNSMGGYVAMVWALADPSAMARLVVVHAPGVPEPRLVALKLALAVPGVAPILRALVSRRPEEWAHRHVHYYDESLKSREEARVYGAALAREGGVRAFVKYLRETMDVTPMRAFQRTLLERRAAGAGFPVPLLLLYAERDPMVPARIGDVLAARIPDASFVRLERASHFAHVDAVERFAPPVLAFLADRAGL